MLIISTALVHVDRTRTHVVKSLMTLQLYSSNGSARFPDRWTRRAYGMRWRRCSLTRCVCLVLWWCSPMCWWRGEEIRAARSCPPSTGCFWSWPCAGWWRRSSSTTHTGHPHQCCSLSFLFLLRTGHFGQLSKNVLYTRPVLRALRPVSSKIHVKTG